ncbi:MAG: hypothetical protein AAGL89_02945 [Pseudomonadota bacterium]
MSEGLAAQLAAIGSNPNATNEGIRTLALIGGEVRVRGPQGYCVDQGASDARTGFAVMAGCALMSDEVGVMPTLDGLITVQFGAPDTASVSGNEEAFAAFLRSEAGRGLLAGNGELASIGEVNTITDQAGVLARFSDDSGPPISGTTGPQWRGFLDINGRLTTISVLSFERAPLSRGQGERLLVVAMAELAEVNAPATPVE